MRALTVVPQQKNSLAVTDVPDPQAGDGDLLVDGLAVGVCGTDREIAAGEYGWAPPGRERLILGHESLGRVREAPEGSEFAAGDLVVGVVRRPDPVPCGACAHGAFDMCRNGRYTERGIKELPGYASERWCVETGYAVRLDPGLGEVGVLLEPTSVVAKAWRQVELIGGRSWFEPRTVLVTGAAALVLAAMGGTGSYGLTCLIGVSPEGRRIEWDAGGLNRTLVLENDAVLGSVNANADHYLAAADALARADRDWLARLLTRRVPLAAATDALRPDPDGVKTVITLQD